MNNPNTIAIILTAFLSAYPGTNPPPIVAEIDVTESYSIFDHSRVYC
jgi:hypothetical protein